MNYQELLIGCGRSRDKRLVANGTPQEFECLTTLDIEPACEPHVHWDLNDYPWPFKADSFDEVHAYEVLEHLGQQGDYRAFFRTFSELWRILKPDGLLCATVPALTSRWLWGDPGHTRVISVESLTYLDQREYSAQCDGDHRTSMTDYRSIYTADFTRLAQREESEMYAFILQAVKPSRHQRG